MKGTAAVEAAPLLLPVCDGCAPPLVLEPEAPAAPEVLPEGAAVTLLLGAKLATAESVAAAANN